MDDSKATELGASEFIAVEMQRSIVKLNSTKASKSLKDGKKLSKKPLNKVID